MWQLANFLTISNTMKATEVTPAAWKDEKVLYDKGNYSAIWGKYQDEKCLGVRWSGNDGERGYPGQGNYPTWYIEPDFLVLSILQKLLELAIEDKEREHISNILFAIKEYSE